MSEPVKAPRFPFVAAALCAACVGAAVWTWMRYSYAVLVTPADLDFPQRLGFVRDPRAEMRHRWSYGRFVRVEGTPSGPLQLGDPADRESTVLVLVTQHGVGNEGKYFTVVVPARQEPAPPGTYVSFSGRAAFLPVPGSPGAYNFRLDATAGRFTSWSVAGLVVGAVGVLVFVVVLRRWLKKRRAFREAEQGDG